MKKIISLTLLLVATLSSCGYFFEPEKKPGKTDKEFCLDECKKAGKTMDFCKSKEGCGDLK